MQIQCVRIPNTPYVCLAGDKGISRFCLEQGRLDWDRSILNVPIIKQVLKPGNVCIDIGAYIGDTTIIFENAGCTVFAMEPRADAFTCLQFNCTRTVCVKRAAGLKGQKVIFTDKASETFDGNLGGRQVRTDAGAGDVAPEQQLPALALDELNPHTCHFMKIDAEGFEPYVLEGGRSLIERTRPVMHIEINIPALRDQGFSGDEVIHEMLRDWRYKYQVRQPERLGTTTPWDIVCVPEEFLAK